jgi:hypothetical protein
MTHFSTPQDTNFPYVLVCSTVGTIISLAAVWISAAYTYAPAMVRGLARRLSTCRFATELRHEFDAVVEQPLPGPRRYWR